MGWSGSLSTSSAVGSAITYTPDVSSDGAYSSAVFTAPKKGVYRFSVKGSGGVLTRTWSGGGTPGEGGLTTGYLMLEAGQVLYVSAGGPGSAAYVSKASGAALKDVEKSNLYFVAGGGGGNGNGDGGRGADDGVGGGETGATGGYYMGTPGAGGTQTSAGSSKAGYGYGAPGAYSNENDISLWGGRGGDGLYGGGAGTRLTGGGGGSGYIHTQSVQAGKETYTNATQQGGGASGGTNGSVTVTYYAQAELPIIFNGVNIERLIFNGVDVESLIYNGVKLFMRRWRECLQSPEPTFA